MASPLRPKGVYVASMVSVGRAPQGYVHALLIKHLEASVQLEEPASGSTAIQSVRVQVGTSLILVDDAQVFTASRVCELELSIRFLVVSCT